jgi:dehydrogenase/reductase SDR family protein 7
MHYSAFLFLILAVSLAMMDCNPSLFLYSLLSQSTSMMNSGGVAAGLPHMGKFENKRVWVVGASSGIGRELAIQLSEAGASLVISARRESDLAETKSLCKAGSTVHVAPLDVLSSSAILSAAVDSAIESLGGIDILVLNAGRSQRVPALESPISMTREIMKLNFDSQVELAMMVMRQDGWVEKQAGHIAVTSSVAGKLPVALSTSYSASKAALHGYFNGLRSEHKFLRVDLVCPGPVATPIGKAAHGVAPGQVSESNDSKQSVERFTHLMLAGMAGPSVLFYETWISNQPALLFTGLAQYTPGVVAFLGKIMGPGRIAAFKGNKDIYNIKSWISEIIKAK